MLNEDVNIVREDLKKISIELNIKDSNEIEVFEEYMRRNNIKLLNDKIDCKIKNLELSNGKYIIFCYDKKDFYHLVSIVDNVLSDKSDESFDLYTIKIYKCL